MTDFNHRTYKVNGIDTVVLAKALPRATVKLLDNAGHLVLDETPGSVMAIAEFFR